MQGGPYKTFVLCSPSLGVLAESEQISQALESAAVLQEVVLKKLCGGGSATNIDAETDRQECLQLLAQLLGLLQAWSTVGGDQVQGLQGLLVEVRGLGLDHLNCHDTQGPDINLRAILLLLDDLRSHPVRCTNHGGTLGLGFGEFGAETEVGCDRLARDV